jgi:hypothetical protein
MKNRFNIPYAGYALIVKRSDLPTENANDVTADITLATIQPTYGNDCICHAKNVFFIDDDGMAKILKTNRPHSFDGIVTKNLTILFEDTPQSHDHAPLRWVYDWYVASLEVVSLGFDSGGSSDLSRFFENDYMLMTPFECRRIYKSDALIPIAMLEMRATGYAGKVLIPFRYEEYKFNNNKTN